MSMILNFSEPRGAATSTISPFFSRRDRLADRRLVREPVLGSGSPRRSRRSCTRSSRSRRCPSGARLVPMPTTPEVISSASITRALARRSSSSGDPVLEHRLLVLCIVVLRVLGDVTELASLLDALGYLAALRGRKVLDLLLELRIALGSEDYFLHVPPTTPETEKARCLGTSRRRIVPAVLPPVNRGNGNRPTIIPEP